MDQSSDKKVRYAEDVLKIARWFALRDWHLTQDLTQEMHIAIQKLDPDANRGLCLRAAKCEAMDYMRSKARNYSYDNKFKHVSLSAMEISKYQIDTEGNVYLPNNRYSIDYESLDDSDQW